MLFLTSFILICFGIRELRVKVSVKMKENWKPTKITDMLSFDMNNYLEELIE